MQYRSISTALPALVLPRGLVLLHALFLAAVSPSGTVLRTSTSTFIKAWL